MTPATDAASSADAPAQPLPPSADAVLAAVRSGCTTVAAICTAVERSYQPVYRDLRRLIERGAVLSSREAVGNGVRYTAAALEAEAAIATQAPLSEAEPAMCAAETSAAEGQAAATLAEGAQAEETQAEETQAEPPAMQEAQAEALPLQAPVPEFVTERWLRIRLNLKPSDRRELSERLALSRPALEWPGKRVDEVRFYLALAALIRADARVLRHLVRPRNSQRALPPCRVLIDSIANEANRILASAGTPVGSTGGSWDREGIRILVDHLADAGMAHLVADLLWATYAYDGEIGALTAHLADPAVREKLGAFAAWMAATQARIDAEPTVAPPLSDAEPQVAEPEPAKAEVAAEPEPAKAEIAHPAPVASETREAPSAPTGEAAIGVGAVGESGGAPVAEPVVAPAIPLGEPPAPLAAWAGAIRRIRAAADALDAAAPDPRCVATLLAAIDGAAEMAAAARDYLAWNPAADLAPLVNHPAAVDPLVAEALRALRATVAAVRPPCRAAWQLGIAGAEQLLDALRERRDAAATALDAIPDRRPANIDELRVHERLIQASIATQTAAAEAAEFAAAAVRALTPGLPPGTGTDGPSTPADSQRSDAPAEAPAAPSAAPVPEPCAAAPEGPSDIRSAPDEEATAPVVPAPAADASDAPVAMAPAAAEAGTEPDAGLPGSGGPLDAEALAPAAEFAAPEVTPVAEPAPEVDPVAGLDAAVVTLFREGREDLAATLSALIVRNHPDAEPTLPHALLDLLVASRSAAPGCNAGDEAVHDACHAARLVLDGESADASPRGLARVLTGFAGMLVPAVLHAGSPASEIARTLGLNASLTVLHRLRGLAAAPATSALLSADGVLAAAVAADAAEADAVRCAEALAAWQAHALLGTTKYEIANMIRESWFAADGAIGRVTAAVASNAPAAPAIARDFIERFADQATVEARIDQCHTQMQRELNRKASNNMFTSPRKTLIDNAAEAVAHVSAWAVARRTAEETAALSNPRARALRRDLLAACDEALAGLADFVSTAHPAPVVAGALACRRAIAVLAAALRDDAPTGGAKPQGAPDRRLVRVPGLALAADGTILDPASAELSLAALAGRPLPDLDEAFSAHAAARRHAPTGLIIAELRRARGDDAVAALEIERAQALADCRAGLRDAVGRARLRLAAAAGAGSLTDDVLRAADQVLSRVTPDAVPALPGSQAPADFPEAFAAVQTVEDAVTVAEDAALAASAERLNALNDRIDDATRARIEARLSARDTLGARDLIDAAMGKAPPSGQALPTPFDAFFPAFPDALASALRGPRNANRVRAALDAVRSGAGWQGVYPPADASDATAAHAMLDAWYRIHAAGAAASVTHVRLLMESIGFRIHALSDDPVPGAWTMKATPITDGAVCPVPVFGSLAGGEYRIAVVRGDAPGAIAAAAGAGRAPAIVLHPGLLSTPQRCPAASARAAGVAPHLVLDEALVWFLASRPAERLAGFFACALPFTAAAPYAPVGPVPAEVLIRRPRATRALLARKGAGIVYGGRGAGKTTLLRMATEGHAPEDGTVVRIVDLRRHGVGAHEPAAAVWSALAAEMAAAGLTVASASPGDVLGALHGWLGGRKSRRVVLLLDGADAFLAADAAAGYAAVGALAGLMDATQRRFKAVLALTRDPLRHGAPALAAFAPSLRIDPVGAEAEAMVAGPVESLGFRLADPVLARRVVSWACGQPSLIQALAAELLAHAARLPLDPRCALPRAIDHHDLDRVRWRADVQRRLTAGFHAALGTDPVARLAVLLAARATGPRSAAGLRAEVAEWLAAHPQADVSAAGFDAALADLAAIGVLHEDATGWRLTNAAAALAGGAAEVDDRIQSLLLAEPPYRGPSLRPAAPVPAPLTHAQERAIAAGPARVSLVFGSALSGIAGVPGALRGSPAAGPVGVLGGAHSGPDLAATLSLHPNGLAVLPVGSDWRPDWIAPVAAILEHRPGLRAVLVGGPREAWEWMRAPVSGVAVHAAGPLDDGALRAWIAECGPECLGEAAARAALAAATGGLPSLIAEAAAAIDGSADGWADALDAWSAARFARPGARAEAGVLPEAAEALAALAAWNAPLSAAEADDVLGMAGIRPDGGAKRLLRWAEAIGLATPAGEQHRLAPFLARLLMGVK